MPIRSQAKVSTASIVPGVRLDLNPFAQRVGSARLLRNWFPEKARSLRKPFSPKFQTKASTATGQVWAIVDYHYHRSGTPESMLLVFRSNGRIYRRTAGSELEIFPGTTSYDVLNARPKPIVLSNRLFFSDNSTAYLYDGRDFRKWGIPRETQTMTTPAVIAGPGFTASSGVSSSFTWVRLDEAGNRVHESSRSEPSVFSAALSNQKARLSIAAFTPPTGYGITHWSGYMSELNGSAKCRRVNTTPITTTTYDVSALPAGTAASEPIRNDPPRASRVAAQWRNRIAMGDETDKRQVWFSSFGEVKAFNNGSPEESFSGASTTSVSDLVNEFLFPSHDVSLIAEYENMLLVFTKSDGYAIVGTAGILDELGTRGLTNEHFISVGAAGPHAGVGTPFGFAWMTPGRVINLYLGGQQVLNIGDAIQAQLNTIPSTNTFDVSFFWWDGNGRKQLFVTVNCADSDNLSGSTSWRAFVYDFDLGSEQNRPGEWFEWTDNTYTVVGSYLSGDHKFLLGGDTSGDVYQLDVIADPAHFNRSALLGQTYLGSTLQSNPAATLRTGLIVPNNDVNAVGLYVSLVRGTQDGPSTSLGTNPSVDLAVDPINPDSNPAISLTVSSTAKSSGEFLAWLKPETGGCEGGAMAKQFQFEVSYAAGTSNNGEVDGRTTLALDALYKLAFAYQPGPDIKA